MRTIFSWPGVCLHLSDILLKSIYHSLINYKQLAAACGHLKIV